MWNQWLCAVLLSVSGMAMAAESKPAPLTIIYSGNLNGELEPCGCSEESNLGGMRRQAGALEGLRRKNPNLFLISSGGLLVSELPSDRIKSEFILKGMAALRYDALGLQWRDLAFGQALLQSVPLAWVSSNWSDRSFAAVQEVKHARHSLAFMSWLDPRAAPPMSAMPKTDTQQLAEALAQAKKSGAVTVLMTTLPRNEASALVPLQDVDILLIQSKHEEFGAPQRVGDTLVLEPGSRGMRLGRVDIVLNARNKIASHKHQVISLPATVADAKSLAGWYRDYTARLKEDYLKRVELRKALNAGVSAYMSADECKACHAAEYEVWSASKHSHAFETLERVNKTFDPNCIGCHTVAFEKPGGYIDPSVTSNLVNVQCESCHGAGREHVESGGQRKVPNADWPKEKICAQCHVGSHSPSFQFESYWPKIAHTRKP